MPTEPTPTPPSQLSRRRALSALGLAGAGVASAAALAACSKDTPVWNGSPPGKPEASPKASVVISLPVANAIDVPVGTEIVFTATEAQTTQVKLTDIAGTDIPGDMHPDGAGWLPTKALKYGATYTATVTAIGDDSKPVTSTMTFTTMAQPSNTIAVSSFTGDNVVIGTGMPLIFQLSKAVAKNQRAALQRRLMVTTEPFQEGIWTWYTDKELHWRPKEFWKSGTKIFVNARVGGLPLGDNYYGKRDMTLTCSAGPQFVMSVDDTLSPKVLVVTRDGVEVNRIPVSLGKPTWQSSSGVMLIIEKLAKTVFDTRNDPNAREHYVADIEYAQRITWGGEFIHAAPWSVNEQGKRNVSHGCINMSTANAKWLFDNTRIGDVVITKNTGRSLDYGNGWTDWSKPWEEYVKGSAIPYVAPPAPTESPSPNPSGSAAPSATPSA